MANLEPQEWRERLEQHPLPGEGPDPLTRCEGDMDKGYELAAETLAHCMLAVVDKDPTLLDVTKEKEEDPTGFAAASNDKLEAALEAVWPNRVWDDFCGGVTGFQWGWAHNIVRYIYGVDATGNPAIVTIG